MSDDTKTIKLMLDPQVAEFLDQDHVDSDELVNAILRAKIAASGDWNE